MATENTEFGEVSRIKGIAFEYATLGASLLGVVLLGILLVYVAIDAFGLAAADPAWFGVVFGTVILPLLALALYGRRNPAFATAGRRATFRLLGGLALGTAVVILFILADLLLWFLVFTLAVLPTATLLLYGRVTGDPRTNLAAFVTFVVGTVLGLFLGGPIDTYPSDLLIYLWTVGLPVAAVVGVRAYRRAHGSWDSPRVAGVAGGLGVFVAMVASGFALATVTGFDPSIGAIFGVTLVVPTGVYAVETLRDRTAGRLGLLVPIVLIAGAILARLLVDMLGIAPPQPWLDWHYVTSNPSRFPEKAGLYPAIIGSVFIISLVALFSFVLGVATAIYLEEYAPQTGPLGQFTRLVQVNISNLAGVPSVVYGLLGLALFVNLVGIGFGTVIVAAFTLSLLILPIVIISAQEAIRSVPNDLRQASYGMGATKWQTVRNVVVPRSLPGIMTGTILALGRAIGETAPLIMIGIPTSIFQVPKSLTAKGSAMPMQIFAWAFYPDEAFRYGVVAAGVVTLLAVLLTMNSVAILMRNRYQREA